MATPGVDLQMPLPDRPGSLQRPGQSAQQGLRLTSMLQPAVVWQAKHPNDTFLEGPLTHLGALTGPASRVRSASKLPSRLLPAVVKASSSSPWWLNTVWGWDCTM